MNTPKSYAPVAVFTYKRIAELKATLESLKANHLSAETKLFVFSDGPKNDEDKPLIQEIRDYLDKLDGFLSIEIIKSSENKGLAKSIISGVSKVIKEYGKIIVLEDDLLTSRNFLTFQNSALNYYEENKNVFSVSGYTIPIRGAKRDVYFTGRGSSWGWGTWLDRWEKIEWDTSKYSEIHKKSFKNEFNKMGSDMSKMLQDQMSGKINSWAIRWAYNQFLMKQFSLYPTLSKVQNIGTSSQATNTVDRHNRFETIMDDGEKISFDFDVPVALDSLYLNQFLKQFSILTRIKYKILNSLPF